MHNSVAELQGHMPEGLTKSKKQGNAMYLVTVTFQIATEKAQAFAARVQKQAEDSLTEPGCQRFDVWRDPSDPARVFLYEIYDDRAAFEAHLASDHFIAFDAEVGPWITDKRIETAVLKQS